MKKLILPVLFFIFCILILGLTVRGNVGNPTRSQLNQSGWKDNGPFELSPERGRFALTYSIVEDRSLTFDLPVAEFAIPDLALSHAQYVSLFAPGVSYLIIPGYVIGKFFGGAQIGTFAVIGFFAILNTFFIIKISKHLGARYPAAAVAAVAFLFGSPAFSYAISLYQHHISTALILGSLYALLKWKNGWSVAFVWFLFGFSILIDYPNAFMMLPVLLYSLWNVAQIKSKNDGINLNIQIQRFFATFIILIPLLFFLWYNNAAYGNPFQLSGTLQSVKAIDENGQPVTAAKLANQQGSIFSQQDLTRKKTATGFFKTRNMLNGFITHFISSDRGILWFTPVMLVGIAGLALLYSTHKKEGSLITAIVGINVLLYSMWSDPYGGWAFGSRYLIPSYAMLAVGCSLVLTQFRKNYLFLLLFSLIFIYSIFVNSLGAITTSKNPPKVEAIALSRVSGINEKYTFERNYDYLITNGSKSFVWNSYLRNSMSAFTFYILIAGSITVISASLLILLRKEQKEN